MEDQLIKEAKETGAHFYNKKFYEDLKSGEYKSANYSYDVEYDKKNWACATTHTTSMSELDEPGRDSGPIREYHYLSADHARCDFELANKVFNIYFEEI